MRVLCPKDIFKALDSLENSSLLWCSICRKGVDDSWNHCVQKHGAPDPTFTSAKYCKNPPDKSWEEIGSKECRYFHVYYKPRVIR